MLSGHGITCLCRGRVTSIATGQGAVRRMHFAPPTCNQLDHVASSLTGPSLSARVCCLFVNGAFGVWELDSRNELRAVGCLCLFLIAGHAFKVLSAGVSFDRMHSCVLCPVCSVHSQEHHALMLVCIWS